MSSPWRPEPAASSGTTQGQATRRPQRGYEVDFLPAALEVIHRPPSPTARVTALLLVLLLTLLGAWSVLASLDVVAVASGRIVPSGNVKIVQPLEPGTVRRIAVRDGDRVNAGDVLIEIDPTQSLADRVRTEQELGLTRLEAARFRALAADDPASFVPPAGVPQEAVALARRHLEAQLGEARARFAAIERQIGQKQAERETNRSTVARLQAIVPFLQEKTEMRAELFRLQAGSRLNLLDARQQLVDVQMEAAVTERRADEIASAIAVLETSLSQARADHLRTVLAELTQREQRIVALEQELIKVMQRQDLQTLRAPVSGTVQQVAVHTVGGVVTTAQQLLVIVPADAELEIVANLANKDVGFVVPGQGVEVKVEAYAFTRYGLIPGRVTRVSSTSVGSDPTASAAVPNGQPPGEPASSQPVYLVHVALDRTTIETEHGAQPLRPGLAVQAEITTGRRSVIDYLVSPLARYRQEAWRER